MAFVDAVDFSALDADTASVGFPVDLTQPLSSLSAKQQDALQAFAASKGVDFAGITGATTLKDVLRRALQKLDPAMLARADELGL
jgi:hypothetical protein